MVQLNVVKKEVVTVELNINPLCKILGINPDMVTVETSPNLDSNDCFVDLRYGNIPATFQFQVFYDGTDSGDVDFCGGKTDDGVDLNGEDEVEEFIDDLANITYQDMEDLAKDVGIFAICGE